MTLARRAYEQLVIPRSSTTLVLVGLPVSAKVIARGIHGADVPMPNVLSARHLSRSGRGLLFAATSSVPWAELMMRTFAVDVLCCPRCSGRLRLVALMTEPKEIGRFLRALGEPTEAPERGPARAPPYWANRALRRRDVDVDVAAAADDDDA